MVWGGPEGRPGTPCRVAPLARHGSLLWCQPGLPVTKPVQVEREVAQQIAEIVWQTVRKALEVECAPLEEPELRVIKTLAKTLEPRESSLALKVESAPLEKPGC